MQLHLVELVLAVLESDTKTLDRLAREQRPCRAWREALLMTALFAGFPRVVSAAAQLHKLDALGDPSPDELAEPADHQAAGHDTFQSVYGSQSFTVGESLGSFHPLLATWIREFAYGRVLSRAGLSLADRECLAVTCLAHQGLPHQLKSHLRGARRAAADPTTLRFALEAGLQARPAAERIELRKLAEPFLQQGDSPT